MRHLLQTGYGYLSSIRSVSMGLFHRGGPRVKQEIERPITDVVAENLIGSLT